MGNIIHLKYVYPQSRISICLSLSSLPRVLEIHQDTRAYILDLASMNFHIIEICQIRLDFDTFSTTLTSGQCIDSFDVTAPSMSPTYRTLCGTLTGQHSKKSILNSRVTVYASFLFQFIMKMQDHRQILLWHSQSVLPPLEQSGT